MIHARQLSRIVFLAVVVSCVAWQLATFAQGQLQLPPTAPTYSAIAGDPVDLSTGLYYRTTVDLVINDVIPIIFSRTYVSGDSFSRPFGVGTNHSYGTFLAGDAPALTYVVLALPDGGRINYRRIAGSAGVTGAVFEHTETPTEYRNSRLSWNGAGWTIQLRDGTSYTYPSCSPSLLKACTVSSYRDPEGNQLRMRHDRRMNLVEIRSPNGATIELKYDGKDRILLARTSHGQQVQYEYDDLGRLVRVTSADGAKSRYGYDRRHQMIQIDEPGVSIKNSFDPKGRCVLNEVQIDEVDEQGKPTSRRDVYKFAYTENKAGDIVATEVEQPNGRRKLTFDERGYRLSDTTEPAGAAEFGTSFRRDPVSNAVKQLTVWCGVDPASKIEIEIEHDASSEVIRRLLQRVCLGNRKKE
jgi:YD repeat-containing protein